MEDENRRVVRIDKTIFTVFLNCKRWHFDKSEITHHQPQIQISSCSDEARRYFLVFREALRLYFEPLDFLWPLNRLSILGELKYLRDSNPYTDKTMVLLTFPIVLSIRTTRRFSSPIFRNQNVL